MRPEGPDGFYDERGALKYNDYLRVTRLSRRQSLARLCQFRHRRRRQCAVGLVPEKCRPAGQHRGKRQRNALSHPPRHRVHRSAGATGHGAATCAISSRTGPTSCPSPMPSCTGPNDFLPRGAQPGRIRQRPPGPEGIHERAGGSGVFARRGARKGDPGLYGPDQAVRRPDGRAVRLAGRDRAHGRHDDRGDLRPRRFPGRPLDGREDLLPRRLDQGSADHLRPVA